MHAMITSFINTSFNIRGEPIVSSVKDAFLCFMGTDLDILVCENYILFKEKQYEKLKEENKTYYSNGTCRGDLTTQQNLSNGEFKGYAYRCKTIQPNGFAAEIVMVEEFKLKVTTKEKVINSYTIYA